MAAGVAWQKEWQPPEDQGWPFGPSASWVGGSAEVYQEHSAIPGRALPHGPALRPGQMEASAAGSGNPQSDMRNNRL